MTGKNSNGNTDQSRRNLLKLAATGLLASMVAPLVDLGSPMAAGMALQGKNVLTVYYSWTGNTRSMAGMINDVVGGDMVRIETAAPYPTEYRETTKQARKELESGFKPPLTTRLTNMDTYDVIFVGSPCWWGTIATPVISFLSGYDLSGKTLVPFMTHKGSGLGRTAAHMRELCPASAVLQGKALWGDSASKSGKEISDWLRSLNMA